MRSTPQQRWTAAERIAERPDHPDRRRRGRRIVLCTMATGLIFSTLQTLLRVVLGPSTDSPTGGGRDQPDTFWIGLAVMGLGLLALVAVTVRAVARGPVDLVAERVESPLLRSQRRHVRRVLRGAAAATAADRLVVAGLAHEVRRAAPVLLALLGSLAVTCIGVLIAFADLPAIALTLGLGSLVAVMLGARHLHTLRRDAERFLSATH